MNNAIRTILVTVTGLVAFMASFAGCVTNAANVTTCTASWLPPQYAAYAVMAFSGLGLLMKALRPGGILAGLFGATAVISNSGAVGTVTPTQVASGPR